MTELCLPCASFLSASLVSSCWCSLMWLRRESGRTNAALQCGHSCAFDNHERLFLFLHTLCFLLVRPILDNNSFYLLQNTLGLTNASTVLKIQYIKRMLFQTLSCIGCSVVNTIIHSGPVWQILLRIPRLIQHKTHIIMLKACLHFVQYPMNTSYIRDLNAFYYISQIGYIGFLVFFHYFF